MRPTSLCLLLLAIGCRSGPEEAAPTLDLLPLAEDVAARGAVMWPAEDRPLGWIETVLGFGMHRLYQANDDAQWQDYYRVWLTETAPEFEGTAPRSFNSSDSMSVASVASTLMIEDPTADLTPLTVAAEAYLDTAGRTDEGAITHWGDDTPFVDDDEIWVDSLFMFGMFMLREYERTGDRQWLDDFADQYVLFSDLCRDTDAQLYRHAYDDGTDSNIPTEAVFWARGNSWVVVAAAEMLTLVPADDPAAIRVAPLFEAHAEAVLATQADDGLWPTVLASPYGDDPDNYTETSASALIAWGLLRGTESVLDADRFLPAVVRAVHGVEDRIYEGAEGPVVSGTSYGTNPGDYDYYVAVPFADDQMLGVGSVIALLAEAHGLEDIQ